MKKTNAILLVASAILYFSINIIWSNCPITKCSEGLIDNYLATLLNGSIFLSAFFLFFLFLPVQYFEAWFKRIFSWAFPLIILLVTLTHDTGEVLSISRVYAVQILGTMLAVVTILFVLYTYLVRRRGKTS